MRVEDEILHHGYLRGRRKKGTTREDVMHTHIVDRRNKGPASHKRKKHLARSVTRFERSKWRTRRAAGGNTERRW